MGLVVVAERVLVGEFLWGLVFSLFLLFMILVPRIYHVLNLLTNQSFLSLVVYRILSTISIPPITTLIQHCLQLISRLDYSSILLLLILIRVAITFPPKPTLFSQRYLIHTLIKLAQVVEGATSFCCGCLFEVRSRRAVLWFVAGLGSYLRIRWGFIILCVDAWILVHSSSVYVTIRLRVGL